jgi:hypothetical protein
MPADRRSIWQGNQPPQHGFLADLMPGWTLYQGGYGSGKTWAGARKLLALHAINHGSPGAILAPTYGDLWRVCVPAVMEAAAEIGLAIRAFPGAHADIRYPHLLTMGRPIMLVSADEPDRIAGWEVGHLWVDEAARIPISFDNPRRDAPTQLRGRLRHRKARSLAGVITTTPEGRDTWVQRDWFDDAKPEHRHWIGRTVANSALDPTYATTLKGGIGKDLAEQYLEGKAISYSAHRAHPSFDPAVHVQAIKRQPHATRHIGADFNVSPMTWVLVEQLADGSISVLDEMILPNNGQVDTGVHACHAKGWHLGDDRHPLPVVIHPDRSSKRRSTTGDPEVVVMLNTAKALGWSVSGDAFGVNPPIDSRINLLARLIMDATGKPHLRIDPRCVKLIDDLERTARKSTGYDPGPAGDRGHILDALGYACWDLCQPGQKATAGNWRL